MSKSFNPSKIIGGERAGYHSAHGYRQFYSSTEGVEDKVSCGTQVTVLRISLVEDRATHQSRRRPCSTGLSPFSEQFSQRNRMPYPKQRVQIQPN
ncbi:MAG: hypothetical protein HOE90_19820 [Bacteriovoracaceae bacterium]|nr:hypothetical protein [Bacteriovoracaceae bacterium]